MTNKSEENNIAVLDNVTFRWAKNSALTLSIPSLNINKGELLFIKGASGSGKSTLLSLLTGINQPESGSISILGQDLTRLSSSQIDKFRADHVGYIFQQFNLLPYLSVIENVVLSCQFSKKRKASCNRSPKEDAAALLTQLNIPADLHHKKVSEISIGQQQRVAAARSLLGKPSLIIADEPTSSLDHDNRVAFIKVLMAQVKEVGATLIFVSHDSTLEPYFTRSLSLSELNRAGDLK
ncbi:ABC transporter ATP-binding protein [Vibrio sp. SS-MA-C1-2]|uniref:ABC transporter ATP-binding protein n=1 Tax=Vibrio sp. SS-MA-C1-2 TaxID=2908646 RepID=UPI001F271293|nr:ABC transporter ATP-binding protein [Vibrio sp. SS-MA-C1-2]UJF18616.1 ABC transporter ATP-binding protein [Vibrio sp. SS-MA-C1-2]